MTMYTRQFAGDIEIEYNTETGDVLLYNGPTGYVSLSEEGFTREDIVRGVRLLENIARRLEMLSETKRGLVYGGIVDFLCTHVQE